MESAFGVDHGWISKDLKGFKSMKHAPKPPSWKSGIDSAFKSKSSGAKHFMPKAAPTVPAPGKAAPGKSAPGVAGGAGAAGAGGGGGA